MALDLSIEDRRKRVVELLAEKGFLSLADLARTFEVSESTLRRDLEILDEQGTVKRAHGGAVYVKDGAQQLGHADREAASAPEKAKIARAVAGLIAPGQTILLDGGTTCVQVARQLAGRRLSVVTNSVPIASVLMGEQETEVTLIGGYLYPRTGVALGDLALKMVDALRADALVLSCAGLLDGWAYNANQMMVDVERGMMARAGQVILALDHTKIGRCALAKLCSLQDVDVVVTDDGAAPDQLAALRDGGARRVLVAGRDGPQDSGEPR